MIQAVSEDEVKSGFRFLGDCYTLPMPNKAIISLFGESLFPPGKSRVMHPRLAPKNIGLQYRIAFPPIAWYNVPKLWELLPFTTKNCRMLPC